MNIPHGLFNKSSSRSKMPVLGAPTRRLYDLFWAIHGMKEQNPPDVVALSAKHEVVFLPPGGGRNSLPLIPSQGACFVPAKAGTKAGCAISQAARPIGAFACWCEYHSNDGVRCSGPRFREGGASHRGTARQP
jgi:hypothetical protein